MLDDVKMHEIDDDMRDLGLGGPDKADDDNADLDPDFKEQPMIVQLGKVLDSRGNPNPIEMVVTDDGKKHKINATQAQVLKMFLTANYDINTKRQFTKDLQTSDTMELMLKGKNPQEMKDLFMDKYSPKGRERSAYA